DKNRLYRFFLRNDNYSLPTEPGANFSLSENLETELFHQLRSVLRLEVGDKLLFQLPRNQPTSNQQYLFKVLEFNKKQLNLTLVEVSTNQNYLKNQVNIALSLPNKPAKLEFLLQKSVELGVSK